MNRRKMNRRTITAEQFRKEYRAQADAPENIVFKCPSCNTLQSGKDLIAAGAGANWEEVVKYAGFACVGRFGKDGDENKRGCKLTLGGFLRIHPLTVVGEDGAEHPYFELATQEEADAHRAAQENAK